MELRIPKRAHALSKGNPRRVRLAVIGATQLERMCGLGLARHLRRSRIKCFIAAALNDDH
jgi:hypothetical protein